MRSADAILDQAARDARHNTCVLRFAEVTGTGTGTVTVNFDGTTVTIPRLSSYTTPVVGDRAWLLQQGTVLVAIGKG